MTKYKIEAKRIYDLFKTDENDIEFHKEIAILNAKRCINEIIKCCPYIDRDFKYSESVSDNQFTIYWEKVFKELQNI